MAKKRSPVRVVERQLTLEDYDEVVELQLRCFPTMKPWTPAQFESLVTRFPAGQLCVELNGAIVASSSSLIVDSSDYPDWHDWDEISDHGFIRNHDDAGDTLYGIEVMVDPEHRGKRFARRLYDRRKELCREKNLARMAIGGRIPGYAEWKGKLTAAEYCEKVVNKDLYDPVLTSQLANGFVLKQLIGDYLPSDEDSAGYATSLEWSNLDYVAPERKRTRRVVEQVRVAAVQYALRTIHTLEDFARQCEFFVDVAADQRADFVLFPELFTLQLLSLVEGPTPGQGARQLAGYTDDYNRLFSRLAVDYNINIIAGSQFVMEEDRLLNVAHLYHRDGRIDRQAKIHPTPSERRWWGVRGGDEVHVFESDRGKVAILICYDSEFPELARIAAHKGALIFFVPYNTQDRLGHIRVRTCSHARAIENGVYVVTAGCVGNLPFVDNADVHYAQSAILTPSDVSFARDGVASEASPNIETVLVQDIDLQLLHRHRRAGAVRTWMDRRTDLYGVRYRSGDTDDVC